MRLSVVVRYCSLAQGALDCYGHDISGQNTSSSDNKADVRAQNHHRCRSAKVSMSTSVSESARRPAMDELALQHPSRPKPQRKSPRSATASGRHSTQRTSNAPVSHYPLATTLYPYPSAATDIVSRSSSLSQTLTSKAHSVTRTLSRASGSTRILRSHKYSRPSCADENHDSSIQRPSRDLHYFIWAFSLTAPCISYSIPTSYHDTRHRNSMPFQHRLFNPPVSEAGHPST